MTVTSFVSFWNGRDQVGQFVHDQKTYLVFQFGSIAGVSTTEKQKKKKKI